jgi:hypothetical protein
MYWIFDILSKDLMAIWEVNNVPIWSRVASVDWICLAADKDQCRAFASAVVNPLNTTRICFI